MPTKERSSDVHAKPSIKGSDVHANPAQETTLAIHNIEAQSNVENLLIHVWVSMGPSSSSYTLQVSLEAHRWTRYHFRFPNLVHLIFLPWIETVSTPTFTQNPTQARRNKDLTVIFCPWDKRAMAGPNCFTHRQ
ncbi:unnamed protein product [Microthlaspi erraticum]|uniref:Uncharacterized protein n=1 Tax=Microthlaspi erraticum TaxID=1685480 RepID=A0A6D2LGK3_9BRAS|nr:unnamed protein product [Microthlaspi erraticum]